MPNVTCAILLRLQFSATARSEIRAQTGLTAARHSKLDHKRCGATNRMTGPSPIVTFMQGAAHAMLQARKTSPEQTFKPAPLALAMPRLA